jgi:hypothetical protein
MPQAYKIPQNVDLEDKIFGPLTLKQFLIAMGAGVATFFSFSLFYALAPFVFWAVTVISWSIAAAFIFVRPNDQPFSKFLFSFIWFATKPSRRAWKRIPSLGEIAFSDETKIPKVKKREEPSDTEVRSKLQHLAHVVDTRGWSEVDDEDDVGGRVTSDLSAKPKLNIFMADEDQPQDILAAEDSGDHSDRTSGELEKMLRDGVPKPHAHGARK